MNLKQGIFLLTLVIIFFVVLKITSHHLSTLPGKKEKINIEKSQDDEINVMDYYTAQEVMTDPGKYSYLYEGIPSEVSELRNVLQGVLIHIFHYHRHGIELSEKRKAEVNLRRVEEMGLLDQVAELTTTGNSSFSEIRALYESNSDLRMEQGRVP